MDTSATWVLNSASQSLGYLLSSAGYDVWLANSRGNQYSSHVTYATTDSKFWNFDFDSMIDQDVPATLAYVLTTTGVKVVDWVAHSQGGAITVAAIARHAAVRQAIAHFAALAPVTFLQHQQSPLMKLMADARIDTVLNLLPAMKFVPSGAFMHKTLGLVCMKAPSLCDGAVAGLFGAEGPNLNPARTGVYFGHFPDGTSTRNIEHWIRNCRSGSFADMTGTAYDLTSYNVKTAIWYGSNDLLADPTDVETLFKALGANVHSTYGNAYAHMDFVWSEHAVSDVYTHVQSFLST